MKHGNQDSDVVRKIKKVLKGFKNRPPQNVPIWLVDYFELKAVKTLQSQENLLPLP